MLSDFKKRISIDNNSDNDYAYDSQFSHSFCAYFPYLESVLCSDKICYSAKRRYDKSIIPAYKNDHCDSHGMNAYNELCTLHTFACESGDTDDCYCIRVGQHVLVFIEVKVCEIFIRIE